MDSRRPARVTWLCLLWFRRDVDRVIFRLGRGASAEDESRLVENGSRASRHEAKERAWCGSVSSVSWCPKTRTVAGALEQNARTSTRRRNWDSVDDGGPAEARPPPADVEQATARPMIGEIFRQYGPAYRRKYGTRMSRDQLQVMDRLERCRTGELGHAVSFGEGRSTRTGKVTCSGGGARAMLLRTVLPAKLWLRVDVQRADSFQDQGARR